MKNKKAQNPMYETIMYIIFTIVVFSIVFLFVTRAGSQASIYEQIYSKQIALAIDKAKAGMQIELDVSELYDIAEKNKFTEQIINIDNEENKVVVKLIQGKGYSFNFFNKDNIVWNLDKKKGLLLMEVKSI